MTLSALVLMPRVPNNFRDLTNQQRRCQKLGKRVTEKNCLRVLRSFFLDYLRKLKQDNSESDQECFSARELM